MEGGKKCEVESGGRVQWLRVDKKRWSRSSVMFLRDRGPTKISPFLFVGGLNCV